jgi:hypothetical protein
MKFPKWFKGSVEANGRRYYFFDVNLMPFCGVNFIMKRIRKRLESHTSQSSLRGI